LGGVAFTTDSASYFGTGYNGTEYASDFYKYDFRQDSWEIITKLSIGRVHGIGFSINNKGYISSGFNPSVNDSAFLDLWELNSIIKTGIVEIKKADKPSVYPNPCSSILNIDEPFMGSASLYSVDGKLVYTTNTNTIDVSTIDNGVYSLVIKGRAVKITVVR